MQVVDTHTYELQTCLLHHPFFMCSFDLLCSLSPYRFVLSFPCPPYHVAYSDAPALSGLNIGSPATQPAVQGGGENDKGSSGGDQWDDEALAATLTRKTATTGAGTTSELMDMKKFDPKVNEQDEVAEKLRVEENKAKLAAAKEGMEREAARLKEEKEKKAEAAAPATASRFAAAAAGGAGGKWVPPHMRGGALPKIRMGGGATSGKVDTQNEELFPDLASADAIIKQQEGQQQTAYRVVKKTPVGGGATWGNKVKPQEPAKAKTPPRAESPKKDIAPEPEAAPSAPAVPSPEKPKTTTAEPAATATAAAAPKKTLGKKKKKKDISTFKS